MGPVPQVLFCSFINDFLKASTRVASPAAHEYAKRLKALYSQHAPDKTSKIDDLLRRSKGDEHNLYLKVCQKYKVDPEEEYAPSTHETFQYKRAAAETALDETVKGLDQGQQWAVMGDPGHRKFA